MASPRYLVGIDLGTTNSAVAFVELRDESRAVQSLPVPQLVRAGDTEDRPGLPSFLYLGGEHELAPGVLALPWDTKRSFAVGEFAREQGARVPGRLVSSAKSWLCHGGVDREAAILPWGAPEDVAKVSPVDAAGRYLSHLREAWERRFPSAPLADQQVIVTVPASFDEVARELTLEAARRAGLPHIVLLEEPQAAFYAWLHRHEARWQEELADVHLAVVVDVGGGTTDFSLIQVKHDEGRISLERLAVGDHLLLGGDNFDAALAHRIEPRLGAKLDSQRWHALTNLCRSAKEALFTDPSLGDYTIRLPGRGGSVVGGTLTAKLTRAEVEEAVVDGFFPVVDANARPRRNPRAALQEWGLPFANEPEITRHLAEFVGRHAADGALPDAILFNGGALKPDGIRDRLTELLGGWRGGSPPRVLVSDDLDLAVARGAAYYGLVRRGRGVRIAGGSPRAFYLGVGAGDSSNAELTTVLCVAHRGMQEGEEVEVAEPPLEVLANRPVSFPLFASSTRLGDAAGAMVSAERESFTEMPPIRTVLRFGKKLQERTLPVSVVSKLTEVGTLELWCRSLTTDHRWRLQFQLRDQALVEEQTGDEATVGHEAETVVSEAALTEASATLAALFPKDGSSRGNPVTIVRTLETQLGIGKDAWPVAAVRALWDVLWQGVGRRAVSEALEARWLNLCGFLLRPGFGADLDEWRVQQLWRMRSDGLCHPKAAQCRAEWWNLWKRIAGGLTKQQQGQVHQELAPYLLPRLKNKAKGTAGAKPGPQEIREYWSLLANCERLSGEMKAELMQALLPAVEKGKATEHELWVIGRLGTRSPMYGPLNCVVKPNALSTMLAALMTPQSARMESVVFALVQLARCVGDRERDVDDELRGRIAKWVADKPTGERAARLLTELVPLAAPERARILDESLPAGLQIRSERGE